MLIALYLIFKVQKMVKMEKVIQVQLLMEFKIKKLKLMNIKVLIN
jgi:hypothetical protein